MNYYEVLELSIDATLDDIKKAHRRLALQYHPDKNKEEGAAETFLQIQAAYEVLSDPLMKESYDNSLGSSDLTSSTEQNYSPQNFSTSETPAPTFSYENTVPELKIKTAAFLSRYKDLLKDKTINIVDLYVAKGYVSALCGLFLYEKINNSVEDKEFLSLHDELKKLETKYLDRCAEVTMAETLRLHDSILGYLQQNWQGSQLKIESSPFYIKFKADEYDQEALRSLIEKSPFNKYLESSDKKVGSILKSFGVEKYKSEHASYNITPEYFDRNNDIANLSDEENNSNRKSLEQVKQKLLDYIETRANQNKYTGWKWGFKRTDKVQGAALVYRLLLDPNNHNTFFHPNKRDEARQRYLKAANQGKLGKIVKEALAEHDKIYQSIKNSK